MNGKFNYKFGKSYKFPKVDKRFGWIGLGVIAWLIDLLFRWNPNFTELVYSRGIFVLWRYLFDYTIGLSPIPLMYIGLLILLGWLVFKILQFRKTHTGQKTRNKIASLGFSILSFLSGAYFFFQLLWGYNYHRPSIETYLDLPSVQITPEIIREELDQSIQKASTARGKIQPMDERPLTNYLADHEIEEKGRSEVVNILKRMEYLVPGRVRCRTIAPEGFLMRLGAIGIYLPYLSEGSVDAAVHPIISPFTYTHEISHGYGFGDEGTANVIAYLSCIQSKDPRMVYSGELGYLRYVLRLFYRTFPDEYKDILNTLPPGILSDLKAIQTAHRQYEPLFPLLFNKIYHHYLKSQGVKEGRMSYGKLVPFVLALRKKQKEDPDFVPLLP